MNYEKLHDLKRIVIKAGTSSLTDESSRLDIGKISKLVSEVMTMRNQGTATILVSSGSIGAGMGKMRITERPESISQLQAAAAIGQGLLMQTYEYFFSNYDQPVAQILLTKNDFTNTERSHNLSMTLETLLEWGVVPIVNENDTVATEEIKVGDNDTLAAHLAERIDAELLVILTDVDGLYTGNPDKAPDSELVKIVENITPTVESWGSRIGKGFGGMYTKVQAAKLLSENGIPTVIANSSEPNAISRAMEGEIGTLFLPSGSERNE
jgi:glutamate 5-kinase